MTIPQTDGERARTLVAPSWRHMTAGYRERSTKLDTRPGERVEGELTAYIAARADRNEGRPGRNHANHVEQMWKTSESGRVAEEAELVQRLIGEGMSAELARAQMLGEDGVS